MDERRLRGKVVKAIDLGTEIQLLCADEMGLFSAYLSPPAFTRFTEDLETAGLELKGLEVTYDGKILHVPALKNTN